MLYILCVEFQFCIHYVQFPFGKNGYLRFPRGGGKTLARGGECPPPLNETLVSMVEQTCDICSMHQWYSLIPRPSHSSV